MTAKAPFRTHNLLRDHARPRTMPQLTAPEFDARLIELLRPATEALLGRYRELGLRERVLTLPVMVAVVTAAIWRRVAGSARWWRCWSARGCCGSRPCASARPP